MSELIVRELRLRAFAGAPPDGAEVTGLAGPAAPSPFAEVPAPPVPALRRRHSRLRPPANGLGIG